MQGGERIVVTSRFPLPSVLDVRLVPLKMFPCTRESVHIRPRAPGALLQVPLA